MVGMTVEWPSLILTHQGNKTLVVSSVTSRVVGQTVTFG